MTFGRMDFTLLASTFDTNLEITFPRLIGLYLVMSFGVFDFGMSTIVGIVHLV